MIDLGSGAGVSPNALDRFSRIDAARAGVREQRKLAAESDIRVLGNVDTVIQGGLIFKAPRGKTR